MKRSVFTENQANFARKRAKVQEINSTDLPALVATYIESSSAFNKAKTDLENVIKYYESSVRDNYDKALTSKSSITDEFKACSEALNQLVNIYSVLKDDESLDAVVHKNAVEKYEMYSTKLKALETQFQVSTMTTGL